MAGAPNSPAAPETGWGWRVCLVCAPGPWDPKESARIGISQNQDKSRPVEAFLSGRGACLCVHRLHITEPL